MDIKKVSKIMNHWGPVTVSLKKKLRAAKSFMTKPQIIKSDKSVVNKSIFRSRKCSSKKCADNNLRIIDEIIQKNKGPPNFS